MMMTSYSDAGSVPVAIMLEHEKRLNLGRSRCVEAEVKGEVVPCSCRSVPEPTERLQGVCLVPTAPNPIPSLPEPS